MHRMVPPLHRAACVLLLVASGSALAIAPATPEDPIGPLQAAYARAVPAGEQADLHLELLATVLARVQRTYAREVDLAALAAAAMQTLEPVPAGSGDPAEVFKKAINTALRTLDSYTRYLDPPAQSAARTESSGAFGGLGLEVDSGDGGVLVVNPMPGSPAERAGLLAGDVIVRVGDAPLAGVPLADAVSRMRGQPGTSIALTIRRTGQEEFSVSVTRDTIRRQVLHWNMEGDVLVLRLRSFTTAVSYQVEAAVAEASAARAPRGVVLDLRGNGGGLLREAVQLADLFLAKGEIVSLRGRTPASQRSWQANPAQLLAGAPMLVLLDERSASASELVAAALQENGRAEVMGRRSFGKGSVQTTFPLGERKGALKITTALYHGPSGRSVQKVGVAPDLEFIAVTAKAGTAPGESVTAAVPAVPPPKSRIDPSRCPAVYKAADAALSCAVGYLMSGNAEAFVPSVATP